MTISSTVRTAGPFTSGSSFAFAFKVFAQADVAVYRTVTSTGVVTTLALNTDYTVSLSADQDTNPGGTVTLNTALAAGQSLLIVSAVANTQSTDITNQSGFYPDVINDALDRATVQVQQVQGQANRGIRYPATEISLNAELPKASDRANQYLAFDSNGEVDIGGAVPDQRYYGAKTADPATRNDGSARVAGDLYYNSVANTMKVFNGSAWDTVTTTPVDGDKGDITLSGGAATYTIDNDAVTTVKILNANVTAAKLATDSVETAKIVNLAVTTGKIDNLAVTTGKIDNLAVTTSKIDNLAVTAGKIAAGAVTSAKLDTNIAISGTLGVTGAFTASGGLGGSLLQSDTKSASGTEVLFTGIPSWARKITIALNVVSTSGTSMLVIRAGTSGGIATTNYAAFGDVPGVANSGSYTSGFPFGGLNSLVAADSCHGVFTLVKIGNGNDWSGQGMLSKPAGTPRLLLSAGYVALSGTLDRVALTTNNGTDTFDNGSVTVVWE